MAVTHDLAVARSRLARARHRTEQALAQIPDPEQRMAATAIVEAIRELPLELRLLDLEARARDSGVTVDDTHLDEAPLLRSP